LKTLGWLRNRPPARAPCSAKAKTANHLARCLCTNCHPAPPVPARPPGPPGQPSACQVARTGLPPSLVYGHSLIQLVSPVKVLGATPGIRENLFVVR
jgi:hypothetical protein